MCLNPVDLAAKPVWPHSNLTCWRRLSGNETRFTLMLPGNEVRNETDRIKVWCILADSYRLSTNTEMELIGMGWLCNKYTCMPDNRSAFTPWRSDESNSHNQHMFDVFIGGDGVSWHNSLWKLRQNEYERGNWILLLLCFTAEGSWLALGGLFLFLSAQTVLGKYFFHFFVAYWTTNLLVTVAHVCRPQCRLSVVLQRHLCPPEWPDSHPQAAAEIIETFASPLQWNKPSSTYYLPSCQAPEVGHSVSLTSLTIHLQVFLRNHPKA